MKKLAVLVAVVSIAALAAPAFSATNPFMDVPMNHWAYDAIGQLAAHGILSGYPDGLYKGQQQTTRYEMASALARALAVVDMTKASKQDVEMLKRLVVEFKDELEALGVRVDELDERVAVLEERLGGWHIHGVLALDVTYQKEHNNPNPDGDIKFDDAKLFIERTWGDEDQYFFRARLNGGDWGTAANFDR
ncbi:MAG: S-layer homology domain-containing protein, partial [Synergistaceae bacterium]|nr:S-layer homology domain-containing protein [Synergistaceae bacterium]